MITCVHRSNWEGFYPRSNVLWTYYLAQSVVETPRKVTQNIDPKAWARKLTNYASRILKYQSSKEVFLNVFSPEVVKMTEATVLL